MKTSSSVARAVGLDPKDVLGNEAQNLRLFLFESLDKTYTEEIQKAIEGCVTIGAQENFKNKSKILIN